METLTKKEAEAFTRVSEYSLEDVRFAWKYWRNAGDQEGFESYIRRRIDGSANSRIRKTLASDRRMAA